MRYKVVNTFDNPAPELVERVSAGKILWAASNLSIMVNFKVFSFVMAYTIIKVCDIFGCHAYHFLCPNPVPLILQIPNI